MATPTQDPAAYYIWEVSGQPVVVHLRLDVVDRLAAAALSGFGAVPKRGAEVGGVLIGTVGPGLPATVRIEDFEPVRCEYRRGPSYLFTEGDIAAFEECWGRWQPNASPSAYAVGFFRSHTRDGFSLDLDDRQLLDQFFPAATQVALLIKPYATKTSVGGIFVRENGVFPTDSPLEFPLRRRELLAEEPAPRRPLMERQMPTPFAKEPPAARAPAPQRSAWVWFPLILLFLLLGAALGYQAAMTLAASAGTVQDFSLSLSAQMIGDNVSVTWNRQSPVIRFARKGLLEIEDGDLIKSVDLDAAQLQNGSLTYHNNSNSVRFRMTVYPQGRVRVVETLEWNQ